MISRLKIFILKCISFFHALSMRRQGVSIGKNCFIDGKPYLRLARGSKVRIGNNVTLISDRRHNPLLEQPVSIRTLSKEAVIELAGNVGISGSNLVCCNRISIGEYTIIGPGTLIYDSEGHDYSPEVGWSQRKVRTGRPISIGAKCFIGGRCMIMSGITIGDNCVIAAGSVITQDVPAGHKASGNPATFEPLPKILGGVGRRKKKADVSSIDNSNA